MHTVLACVLGVAIPALSLCVQRVRALHTRTCAWRRMGALGPAASDNNWA